MLPAIAYAPRAVTKPTAREAAHTLLRSPDAGSPDANTSGGAPVAYSPQAHVLVCGRARGC